jgi:four helix bundle protein
MRTELIDSNPLLKMSIDFSVNAVNYCQLLEEKKQFVVSRQLLRSATSIGANAMEAQNAESKADFIHKLKIAAKEADEVQYWLLICERIATYPICTELKLKLEGLQKMLNKIISSAKKNNTTD